MPDSNSPEHCTPEKSPSRSRSSRVRIAVTLAASLVGCGVIVFQAVQIRQLERVAIERSVEIALVDSRVTPIPQTVGLAGGALVLVVGLLIYRVSAAGRRKRALEEETRQRAEDLEYSSLEEMARILASVNQCLWSARFDSNGVPQREYVSEFIADLTGFPREHFFYVNAHDFTEDPWSQLVVPDDFDVYAKTYDEVALGSSNRGVLEYRITRSDGEIVWVRESYVMTRDLSGESQFDCVIANISASKQAEEHRQRLEERVQQTQKLESIGVLAGGVAHDFNNLLAVVLGNADVAARADDCPTHIRECLQDIVTAAERASELCQELLAYSGRANYVIAPIDLVTLVREMDKLLRISIAPGIQIEKEFAEEVALVEGDATQLRQLVMNLITNAADAMQGSPGKIRLALEERYCEEAELAKTLTRNSLAAGRYVVLTVSDTGCGMTEDTLSRIFDPFFTTKFTGRGLGLASALGIVYGHRGAILVKSKVGVGTRSDVYLPVLEKGVEEATAETEDAALHVSGVVLLVDDDDSVRRVSARLLEQLGMKVISVASGEEALAIIDGDAHEIRCVVLDLLMPGLSGADTLRAIREKDSKLPVLIVTGYAESDSSDLLGDLSANGLLAKPFKRKQLKQALLAALD